MSSSISFTGQAIGPLRAVLLLRLLLMWFDHPQNTAPRSVKEKLPIFISPGAIFLFGGDGWGGMVHGVGPYDSFL